MQFDALNIKTELKKEPNDSATVHAARFSTIFPPKNKKRKRKKKKRRKALKKIEMMKSYKFLLIHFSTTHVRRKAD